VYYQTLDQAVGAVVDDSMGGALVQIEDIPSCPFTCGDIDGSGGLVDLNDFATFALCFGLAAPNPSGCPAEALGCSDLDGNSLVDLNDFATFAVWYGLTSTKTVPDCGE
jgi:hypothetical protein